MPGSRTTYTVSAKINRAEDRLDDSGESELTQLFTLKKAMIDRFVQPILTGTSILENVQSFVVPSTFFHHRIA